MPTPRRPAQLLAPRGRLELGPGGRRRGGLLLGPLGVRLLEPERLEPEGFALALEVGHERLHVDGVLSNASWSVRS